MTEKPAPLEVAARAICKEFGVDPDSLIKAEDDVHVGFGLREPHLAWTRYVGMAAAVLEAVRTPSVKMLAAADDLPCSVSATECWEAMIDAALNEGPVGSPPS